MGILIAHVAAGGAVAVLAGGAAGLAAASLVLLLGGAAARRAGMLRGPRAPTRLTLRPGTTAELELRDGRRLAVSARRVGRGWVSLTSDGRPSHAYFLTAGMTGPAMFRLIRLWALWGRLPAAPAARELNSYANVSRTEA